MTGAPDPEPAAEPGTTRQRKGQDREQAPPRGMARDRGFAISASQAVQANFHQGLDGALVTQLFQGQLVGFPGVGDLALAREDIALELGGQALERRLEGSLQLFQRAGKVLLLEQQAGKAQPGHLATPSSRACSRAYSYWARALLMSPVS